MECKEIVFSGHAVRGMFKRAIARDDVQTILLGGNAIFEYPDDKPLPSVPLLGFVGGRPIHVVVGRDPNTNRCGVITCYEPSAARWTEGFTRRKPS